MDEDVTISRENGIVAENEEKPEGKVLANKPLEDLLSQKNAENGILQNRHKNGDIYSLEGTTDVLDVDFNMTSDSEDSW